MNLTGGRRPAFRANPWRVCRATHHAQRACAGVWRVLCALPVQVSGAFKLLAQCTKALKWQGPETGFSVCCARMLCTAQGLQLSKTPCTRALIHSVLQCAFLIAAVTLSHAQEVSCRIHPSSTAHRQAIRLSDPSKLPPKAEVVQQNESSMSFIPSAHAGKPSACPTPASCLPSSRWCPKMRAAWAWPRSLWNHHLGVCLPWASRCGCRVS